MRTVQILALGVLLGLLSGCGGQGDTDKVEPLSKLDFRPNSDFGFDALMTGLQLGKQLVDERTEGDSVARAEGYRFLFRLIEMNLNTLSGDHDGAHPQVTRCPSKNCKLGFDNPDYSYVGVIPLSADYNYRLFGERGTAEIILFQALERGSGAFVGTSRTSSEAMLVNPDGSWEIFLGKDKPAHVAEGNFLQLKEEQATMVIRIAHRDWNNTIEPSIQVEVLDEVREPPQAFTPTRMAVTGFALSRMIPNTVSRWLDITSKGPLNGVDKPCRSWANGCTEGGFGNFSAGGKYLLDEDEALILEVPWVPAQYRNIQLANIWGESLDYANKQTSLNGHQAHLDADQVYRYVLSHRDPGVPNWLDISEHGEGAIFMRWLNTDSGRDPQQPVGTVVKFDAIRDHLPAQTPQITPAQRAQVLKERLMAYNRRTNPANLH
jgi:hypothetical protein